MANGSIGRRMGVPEGYQVRLLLKRIGTAYQARDLRIRPSRWSVNRRTASAARRWLMVLSVLVVLIAFMPRVLSTLDRHDFVALGAFTRHLVPPFPFAERALAGPVRLLHFFFVAYLVAKWTTPRHCFWSSWIARPIVVCGQNSLEVFCFGLVLTHTVGLLMATYEGGSMMFHVLIAMGWLVTIVWAYVLDCKKRVLKK